MSSQQEDDSSSRPRRQRSNTTFGAFAWRRNRGSDPPPLPAAMPAAPVQTLTLEELLTALSPPAVPSLAHARSLAAALRTQLPPPPPAQLTPILAALCASDVPASLQAAGFDILYVYCGCSADSGMFTTSDRLGYIDLVRAQARPAVWAQDVWEPRLRALSALVGGPAEDILGVDRHVRDILITWINSAFDGMLVRPPAERQERERAVEAVAEHLTAWVGRPEVAAWSSDADIVSSFDFFASVVDRALRMPAEVTQTLSPPPTPIREAPQRHRRHHSSTTGMPSPPSVVTPPPLPKHPLQIAAHVYLMHLTTHISTLPLSYLPTLLSFLFRLLTACMTPLPVLSLPLTPRSSQTERKDHLDPIHDLEKRVDKAISALLTGPYSTACLVLLKRHLLPPTWAPQPSTSNVISSIFPSLNDTLIATASPGAHRTLRLHIRRTLSDALAAHYISQSFAATATPAGAPGLMSLDPRMLERAERAWRREGDSASSAAGAWDASKVSHLLEQAVRAWIAWPGGGNHGAGDKMKEGVLNEVAGLLKDVLQEMDDRAEESSDAGEGTQPEEADEERERAVGAILHELVQVVRGMTNSDGTPLLLPLSRPLSAQTPLLRTLSALLARSPTRPSLSPPLPLTLLTVSTHLADVDTARIPEILAKMHLLSPASPDWLRTWDALLGDRALLQPGRTATRRAVHEALRDMHCSLRDMPVYRRPLVALAFSFWIRMLGEGRTEREAGGDVDGVGMWRVLSDEVVFRALEDDMDETAADAQVDAVESGSPLSIDTIVDAMVTTATTTESTVKYEDPEDTDTVAPMPQISPGIGADNNTFPNSPVPSMNPSHASSSSNSPMLSRMHTEKPGQARDRESGMQMPQLMSLLSFAKGGSSRSHSQSQSQTTPQDEPLQSAVPLADIPEPESVPAPFAATTALIDIFTQLAFPDRPATPRHTGLAVAIFDRLLTLLRTTHCARARLAVLQLLLRLRADRDHRIFITADPAALDTHVATLAALIDRDALVPLSAVRTEETRADDASFDDTRRTRTRAQYPERDGRRASRGRGSQTPNPTPSRSRSRVPAAPKQVNTVPRGPLWCIPEQVSFSLENAAKTSEILISYDPVGPDHRLVLGVSYYLEALVEILKYEKDWEILSYVLVHLPVQLANKHFWCGPMTRVVMSTLAAELCKSISEGSLGKYIPQEAWPVGLKPRDAQGLGYHTLTVLISYQNVLEPNMRHALVEVFQTGLSGMPSTVKCCLHALSLAAFELQPSMIKALPRILEKLSQIMTNPTMAVHILDFLSIVGSLPTLYASFTENDFKMVFGVALQYLQHHNRPETLAQIPFALSQHVRLISYYIVYVWFLATRLSDRPRHVKFITRQLLLANEDKGEIDESTEVCFDWLARYTYASADPKPAPSLLCDLVSDPAMKQPAEEVSVQEKSWLLGRSIVTIRTLAKVGWIQVVSRRASGTTKFLCKSENVPLVGLGDVDPDMTTIPASLMMDRDPNMTRQVSFPSALSEPSDGSLNPTTSDDISGLLDSRDGPEDASSHPDPITGYVWTGSAPSQRRKRVDLDPSFFALQLSAYPDVRRPGPPGQIIDDKQALARQMRLLDMIPVIDTHKVGILYVAPGQTSEVEILQNTHGSPAYTRFLEGIGRLIKLRGQLDVYAGGLDPDEDGEYAYAWWDDIGQILYHTATLMPTHAHDERCNNKKRHIGNDYVRIVWNDSGLPYKFDTLITQFQFVNIVIEPHSHGAIAAFSNNVHENEYFKVTIQRADQMAEFAPIGDFKIVSASSLSPLVRQLSLLSDWYACVFEYTDRDTQQHEFITNWRARLQAINRVAASLPSVDEPPSLDAGIMGQETYRDFTTGY